MEMWPALDIQEGRVVRLLQGDFARETQYATDPYEYVVRRFGGLPRRLHLVDLSGAQTGRYSLHSLVERLAAGGARIQTGGGLRSLGDIAQALDAGAERVVLGSQLVNDPAFRRDALLTYRSRVVAGLDVKQGYLRLSGWRQPGPPAEAFWLALHQEGWRRAQVTDIDRDGTLTGVSESFWRRWAQLPGDIGAGGGVASLQDLHCLLALGIPFAVVGKAWVEGRIPLEELV